MRPYRVVDVRPSELLCLACRAGGKRRLTPRQLRLWGALKRDPYVPVRVRCTTFSVYAYQDPGSASAVPGGVLAGNKRDLDVLQRMGLVPGATRPGWELFSRLLASIDSTTMLCGGGRHGSPAWRGCSRACSGDFGRLKAAGIGRLFPSRSAGDKSRAKRMSAADLYRASVLRIRPHHLMCMACFHAGRQELGPIAEDNLFEAIDAIRRNPKQRVKLVRGCCMICPPCSSYDPATNQCLRNNAMSLRDEKKDLDVLSRLDLSYGDVVPARDLYRCLFRAVRSTKEICGYGDGVVRSWEWAICSNGPDGNEGYRKARACGMGLVKGYGDGGTQGHGRRK